MENVGKELGCAFIYFYFLIFLDVPRLGVKSEPAYTTATATPDPSRVCNIHPSSWQCQILNPLREARDQTHVLMDPSQVCYR